MRWCLACNAEGGGVHKEGGGVHITCCTHVTVQHARDAVLSGKKTPAVTHKGLLVDSLGNAACAVDLLKAAHHTNPIHIQESAHATHTQCGTRPAPPPAEDSPSCQAWTVASTDAASASTGKAEQQPCATQAHTHTQEAFLPKPDLRGCTSCNSLGEGFKASL
jgi:hypothetical protein